MTSFARTAKAWVEAMRLRTLPVSIAGVLTAWGFCTLDGSYRLTPVIICLLFALAAQIASNFANEYFDYRAGRDRIGREGPRRGVTEGDISPRAMLVGIGITLAVAAALGLSLLLYGGWWLIAVGAAVGLGLFAYSTGPYPLSTHGLGEVAVILFFGIVPVTLTHHLATGQWSLPVLLGGISVGLMGANVLIVNNYRDIDDDRAVGKHTLAVRFGRKAMLALYVANALVAALLMLPVWIAISLAAAIAPLLYSAAAILIAARISSLEGRALTPMLGITALLMSLHAIAFLLTILLAAA